jgi:hypothetical protein
VTEWEKICLYFRYELPESLRNIRRRIWNKRLKLWWYQLYVRRDEFHPSLETDDQAIMVMDHRERRKYHQNLGQRRSIAHNRSLAKAAGL